MRVPVISAGAIAAVTALALAGCASQGGVPAVSQASSMSSQVSPPLTQDASTGDAATIGDAALPLTSCATSPPQYDWIFKGSCDQFTLKPTGSSFSLAQYQGFTVKGSIGKNSVKGSAKIALADAVDKNGDIEKWQGKAFPAYKANGTTIIYAVAVNQTNQTIKPIVVHNKPVLEYVITSTKNLPGKQCGAAVLAEQRNHTLKWTSLPAQGTVKGKTVTISQYEVPNGFALFYKTPLYFAVNCFQ